MKFLITSSCLLRGEHIEAGTVLDLDPKDAGALLQAQRGHAVPDDYGVTPETAAEPKGKKK